MTFNTSTGVLSGTPAAGTGGSYSLTFTAQNGVGTNAAQSFTLTVNQAPAITSLESTTFTVGTAGSFTVTATGLPTPTLSETGTLPSGVSFNATTGVLVGTPVTGTTGEYPITFAASNGVGTNATQNFTLRVNQAPAITSSASAAFTTGAAASFTVTTTGTPKPTLAETGTLPSGVTFDTTTGLLSGTPAVGTGGTYPISFTASNRVGSNTQIFTLTVIQGAGFTSANGVAFVVGTTGSFTVTATGFPTPLLSESGTLPGGITFNPSTGVLSGAPASGSAGSYPISFTASNGASIAQSFTLTVNQGPAVTNANNATFTIGVTGSFTVTVTGFPAPTVSETGTLPGGVSFSAASGILSGTPAAGSAGNYPISFTASNGIGNDATQNFTLAVNPPPQPAAITSASSTIFAVGAPGSFTLAAIGFPTPVLSESGALPSGVTFNAGTGVLSGTPTGTVGNYSISFTASNGVGTDATQNFTLVVSQTAQEPSFTSATNITFQEGVPGSFAVKASGIPIPTLSEAGSLPAGVSFKSTVSSVLTPLVQHTSAPSTIWGQPNSYQLNFQPTLAGNTLILCFTMNTGTGVTAASISDSSGITNYTFVTSQPGHDDGNSVSNCAYALNIPAGITWATVTFAGGPPNYVQAMISEFAQVSAVGGIDGSSINSGTGAIVTAGTFRPSMGGDLVYNYVVQDSGGAGSTTSFGTGPAPWTMLCAAIQDNIAAQFQLQPTAAPINPTMTLAPANNSWTSIAFALQTSASAGAPAPAGIHVLRVQHEDPQQIGNYQVQMPCSGNLLVAAWLSGQFVDIVDTSVATTIGAGPQIVTPNSMSGIVPGATLGIDVGSNYEVVTVTAVTDSTFTATFTRLHTGPWSVAGITDNQGNAWQSADGIVSNSQSGDGQIFFAPNASCSTSGTNVLVNVFFGGQQNPGSTIVFYDVTGAASSPLDTATNAQGDEEFGTTINGFSIMPSTPNGLIIGEMGVDANSVVGLSSPGSFLSVLPSPNEDQYPGDENNGWMMYYNPDTTPYSSVWTMNGEPGFWINMAAAFKASPVAIGLLSGTPTVGSGGTYPITFSATNGVDGGATQNFTLIVSSAPSTLQITNLGLLAGQVTVPYGATLTASGGTAPYTWAVLTGGLPPGLALDAATGQISGFPLVPGTYLFTVQATDSAASPEQAAAVMSIFIAPGSLQITTASLAGGQLAVAYNASLSATGGTPPYQWSLLTGTLPAGLTFSASTGVIGGVPTNVGTSLFSVQVADSGVIPQTVAETLSISIAPAALQISTTSAPSGQVGVTYNDVFVGTGGTPPYQWTISAGSLPAGLTLNSQNGSISGTPTAFGTASFTVQVSDSASTPQTAAVTFSIVVVPGVLHITTTNLPSGQVNVGYVAQTVASGGTPPYQWSIQAGELPAGLILDPSSGSVSGTPTGNGPFEFTAEIEDSAASPQTAFAHLQINILPPVSIGPASAWVVVNATQQFVATIANSSDSTLAWAVNGVPGGNQTVGTISTAGLYTAPSEVPSPAVVTVTATSVANPADSNSAAVTIGSSTELFSEGFELPGDRNCPPVEGDGLTCVIPPPAGTWFAVSSTEAAYVDDTSTCHTGAWCGSMTLQPTDGQISDFWEWEPNGMLPTNGFYGQIWLKFPTTWQWGSSQGGEQKIIIFNSVDQDAGGARAYLKIRTSTPQCGDITFDTDSYAATHFDLGYDQGGAVPLICADGLWHSIQYYVNETANQIEVWLDGNAYINEAPTQFYGNGAAYNDVRFGAYMNDPASSTTGGPRTFYTDDFCLNTVRCGGPGTSTDVVLSPESTTVPAGGILQFSATVSSSGTTVVNWAVNGIAGGNAVVGTVSASGLYTAPVAIPSPASVTVTATSVANGTQSVATITITASIASGTQETLLSEGFENDSWEDWGGGSPASISITNTRAASGTYAAVTTHEAGTANNGLGLTYFGDYLAQNPQQTEVSQEFDSYFDPSAQIVTAGGRGTSLSVLLANEDGDCAYVQPLCFAPYYLTLYADSNFELHGLLFRDTTAPAVFQDFPRNLGASPEPLLVGNWQHIKVHAKLNTAGNSDGVLEVWVNGVQTIEYANVDFRDSYTTKGWNMFEISGADGAAPSATWNQYWDNVSLYVP